MHFVDSGGWCRRSKRNSWLGRHRKICKTHLAGYICPICKYPPTKNEQFANNLNWGSNFTSNISFPEQNVSLIKGRHSC